MGSVAACRLRWGTTQAIWRAHGDRMAEILYKRHVAAAHSHESEFVDDGDPNAKDDTNF